jgi:hypothetical protein
MKHGNKGPDPDQIRNNGWEVKFLLKPVKKLCLPSDILGHNLRFTHEVKSLYHNLAFMETKETQSFILETLREGDI